MSYLDTAIAAARVFEGYSETPYRCPAGYWTIGYGFNLEAHGMVKDGRPTIGRCTREQAETWLAVEMRKADAAARRIYPAFETFPDAVKAIVVDLVYNMGEGTLRKFVNTNRALNEHRWNDAAVGLERSRYYAQTGRRAKAHVAALRGLG